MHKSMKYDFASQELPKKRTGWHVHWLARTPAWRIAIFSFLVYAATVLVFSGLESVFHSHGVPLVVDSQRKPVGFSNLFYFNFVTILTIGYGDLSPVGWGRFFSIVEAIIGVAFFSLVVAVITSKMISPPQDTIVFSKYAYYCTDNEKILLIFVNTTNTLCINTEMCCYFKIGGDWLVRWPIRSPFLTRSVQTFFMDHVPVDTLVQYLMPGDVFRCGISGRLGDTSFAAAIEYYPQDILVIPNRDNLTSFKGFWDADFASEEVIKMFHYRPPDAPTLFSYIESLRQQKGRQEYERPVQDTI